MGRRAEGWKLRNTPGGYQVRFTHAQRRYELATGERDYAPASTAAARIYADVVSGRFVPQTATPGASALRPLAALFADWLADYEAERGTIEPYRTYVRAHFLPFFERLDRLTKEHAADYVRARLGKVVVATVRKELSALRTFVKWLVAKGYVTEDAAPVLAKAPPKVLGTRRRPQHRRPDLTDEIIARVHAELPVTMTSKRTGETSWVRDRFVVAWETGLRPSTLDQLEVPAHYRKGQAFLTITDAIDKARFGRELPLTEAARAALDRCAPEAGLIFGRHFYRSVIEPAGERAGVPGLQPYDLRHGRITTLLEQTGNLPGVAFLVGHTKVTTTNLYAKPNQRAASDVLKKSGGDSGSIVGAPPAKGKKKRRAKEGT